MHSVSNLKLVSDYNINILLKEVWVGSASICQQKQVTNHYSLLDLYCDKQIKSDWVEGTEFIDILHIFVTFIG